MYLSFPEILEIFHIYLNLYIIIMFNIKIFVNLAIKRCKWDFSQLTSVQRKRWTNEVDIMRRLEHPNIVKAGLLPFKLPDIDDLPILCMEYCRKGDLRKVVSHLIYIDYSLCVYIYSISVI